MTPCSGGCGESASAVARRLIRFERPSGKQGADTECHFRYPAECPRLLHLIVVVRSWNAAMPGGIILSSFFSRDEKLSFSPPFREPKAATARKFSSRENAAMTKRYVWVEDCETARIAGGLSGRGSLRCHTGLNPCALRGRPFRLRSLFCATPDEFPSLPLSSLRHPYHAR